MSSLLPAHDPQPPTQPIRARTRAELVAVLPFLIGFNPSPADILAVGVRGGRVAGTVRACLQDPYEQTIGELRHGLAAFDGIDDVLICAYGDVGHNYQILALTVELDTSACPVRTVLRVDGDRLHCLLCECTGPDGEPFDAQAAPTAASAVLAGQVAASSRQALLDRVAPDPAAATAVDARLHTVAQRFLADRLTATAGQDLIRSIFADAATGTRLTDAQAATLLLMLLNEGWLADVWLATDTQPWLRELWCDLTRRRLDGSTLVAAPAALAGWACWRAGDTILARAAITRALAADPGHKMAQQVADILDRQIPPHTLTWPPAGHSDITQATGMEPGR